MYVTKLSSLCKCLASTVAMCLPAGFVVRSSTPTRASTDTISLCVVSLTKGRGGDHPQSECVGVGGEEEDGSGQVQEEGRHPLPSLMEIYCAGFY